MLNREIWNISKTKNMKNKKNFIVLNTEIWNKLNTEIWIVLNTETLKCAYCKNMNCVKHRNSNCVKYRNRNCEKHSNSYCVKYRNMNCVKRRNNRGDDSSLPVCSIYTHIHTNIDIHIVLNTEFLNCAYNRSIFFWNSVKFSNWNWIKFISRILK